MTPREESSESDEPQVVVKHGRVYWSAGLIAVLASGIASFVITRSQVESLAIRTEKIEILQSTAATKDDMRNLQQRMDDLYRILIDRQEAGPRFPKTPR